MILPALTMIPLSMMETEMIIESVLKINVLHKVQLTM